MNLPNCFADSKRILFAGIGGGFDLFGAIPLWVSLRNNTKYKFVFSNYNPLAKTLTSSEHIYPELNLEAVLRKSEFDIPIYALPKMGVKAYEAMYNEIIHKHDIDTIVAVDGGVDSLMNGDEDGAGTILEDFANLIAINQLNKNSILVCSGFGTELEEDVCHHHVLENMAKLLVQDGFVGSCSLVKGTEEFQIYKTICDWVWQDNRKSHIQSKVISAVLGYFGNTNIYEGVEANVIDNDKPKNYLSPLMGIYWFFNLSKVMKNNVLYSTLVNTTTKTDVLMAYRQRIDTIKRRERKSLPW